MNKKVKIFLLTFLGLLSASFIWFEVYYINSSIDEFSKQIKEAAQLSDVIIVFNSGGWGTTSPEKAFDLTPLVENIEENIKKLGLNSAVIPYYRTKDNFFAKIGEAGEYLTLFYSQSKKMANCLEQFVRENSNIDILMVGLSNGATFVDQTIEKIPENVGNSVFGVEIGPPFWTKPVSSQNVIIFNKNGKDPLSRGDIPILIASLLKSPFGDIKIPDHIYTWDDIKDDVTKFLEKNLINS